MAFFEIYLLRHVWDSDWRVMTGRVIAYIGHTEKFNRLTVSLETIGLDGIE